jgi:hypothetical protein
MKHKALNAVIAAGLFLVWVGPSTWGVFKEAKAKPVPVNSREEICMEMQDELGLMGNP